MRRQLVGVVIVTIMVTAALTECISKPMEVTTVAPKTKAAPTGDSGIAGTATVVISTADLPISKIAVMPFLNSILIRYMIDNGLDVASKFKIDTVYSANGGATDEVLVANEWEVNTLNTTAVSSLAVYGDYCVIDIDHSRGGFYTLYKPGSPIVRVRSANPSYPNIYGDTETLREVIIAADTGTISYSNTIRWLGKLGLITEDMEVIHMDLPLAYQALTTDSCDVAASSPPASYVAEGEDMVTTFSLADLDVPQFDSIIISGRTSNGRKGALVSCTKTFLQAIDASQAGPGMVA